MFPHESLAIPSPQMYPTAMACDSTAITGVRGRGAQIEVWQADC
jgi:hypothetical protein